MIEVMGNKASVLSTSHPPGSQRKSQHVLKHASHSIKRDHPFDFLYHYSFERSFLRQQRSSPTKPYPYPAAKFLGDWTSHSN
jgi:hypothetical protein